MAIKLASDLRKATNLTQNLYGADVLITYDLITALLKYEATLFGLNLTHSQDKDYISVSYSICSAYRFFHNTFKNAFSFIATTILVFTRQNKRVEYRFLNVLNRFCSSFN